MDAESNPLPPVNSAVASILDGGNVSAAPGRPVKTSGLSMTTEAVRMRKRRAKAKQQQAETVTARSAAPPVQLAEPAAPAPAGDKMTPSHLQLMPDGPSRSTVTPEQMDRAVRDWTRIFKIAGVFAARLFKGEELKLSEQDARDCAEAVLDGWPELASETDADFKKLMAGVVVGSVASDRWDAHKAAKAGHHAARPEPVKQPAASTSVLAMMPVSM